MNVIFKKVLSKMWKKYAKLTHNKAYSSHTWFDEQLSQCQSGNSTESQLHDRLFILRNI